MTIKQFLKPEWRKIVIFLIIVIAFCFLAYKWLDSQNVWCLNVWTYGEELIFENNSIKRIGAPCDINIDEHYGVPWKPCVLYCGKPDVLTSFIIKFYYPLIFISAIVISYLISCLIIFIYDKFKNIKKKK